MGEETSQEKTRIKFRVSAADGVTSSGQPTSQWTEKWGVSLFDFEEFHVTDQLLKLPFQENPPKTVCVFSVATGALQFRLLDSDRLAAVNGVERREAIVGVGDRIRIGETLTIEVVLAPQVSSSNLDSTPVGRSREDGPTLTLTTSGPVAPEKEAEKESPPALARKIFADRTDGSIEIDEPSFKRPATPAPVATAAPAVSRPKKSLLPEPKVELVNLPHAVRDDSLESRMAEFADTKSLKTANLDGAPTLAERILGALSRVLRRDDLTPPDELPSESTAAKPWIPAEYRDPGIQAMRSAHYGAETLSSPRPWIPQADEPGARLRGRALVFLVAAAGTLMIAVGVMRILDGVQQERRERETFAPISFENVNRRDRRKSKEDASVSLTRASRAARSNHP